MSGKGRSSGERICPECSTELVEDGPGKYYCTTCGFSRSDRG